MNQAYQLICCDLDGTLLNEKDEVSEKNKEMIQRCRKQGMQFAIVSGRRWRGSYSSSNNGRWKRWSIMSLA